MSRDRFISVSCISMCMRRSASLCGRIRSAACFCLLCHLSEHHLHRFYHSFCGRHRVTRRVFLADGPHSELRQVFRMHSV